MYTDYNVCAKVTFNTINNHSKLVTLYPLANSADMAKESLKSHIENEYGKDYIKSVEFLHSYVL